MDFSEAFSAEEIASIQIGLAEIKGGRKVHHTVPIILFESIKELWDPTYSPLRFSAAAPTWFIGMTHEFTKAISKIDRKLQV